MSQQTHTWYSQKLAYKNKVRERDNYTCQLCGKEGWQVDHIIPYAVSHDSSMANLRVLCRSCNYKTRRPKNGKLPIKNEEDYKSYLLSLI